MFDHDTKIPGIIARELSGVEPNAAEQIELERWLAESAENRALYEKMASGASLTEYNSIRSRTDSRTMISRLEKRRKKHRLRTLTSVGTAAATLAAVLFLCWPRPGTEERAGDDTIFSPGTHRALLTVADRRIELTGEEGETAWQEFAATAASAIYGRDSVVTIRIEIPRGGEYKLRLPDSTQVWLNSETVIEYPETFTDKKRDIRVCGEAFFDVVRDPDRPFVITTGDGLEVTVLGTRFNVNSYVDTEKTTVSLVDGAVRVGSESLSVILAPHEQAVFDRTEGSLSVVTVEDMRTCVAWMQGQFYYHGAGLDAIFAALERWYDVRIIYNTADIAAIGETTLIFNRRDDLRSVLESLGAVTGLRYRTEGSTIYMTL